MNAASSAPAWRPLEFRADVEGLRAVAVLAVLAFHAGLPFAPGGFVGVDVFFVISGFLITGLLLDELAATGRVALAAFYARRARRLLPAVLLVLVTVAAGSAVLLTPFDAKLVSVDVIAAGLYLANVHFALQQADYLAGDRAESPVLHLWSLGVEEQFYLAWPVLLIAAAALGVRWLGSRREDTRGRALLLAVGAALAVVGVLSLVASVHLTRTVQPWAFFGMPTRAWEFALGGAVAVADRRGLALGGAARWIAAWGGAALLGASVVLITPSMAFPGMVALAPALATAALIAAGSTVCGPTVSVVSRALGSAPARFVGQRSYSLYLWHWPAVLFAVAALGESHWEVKTVAVLASAVPALLAYALVEKPIHRSPRLVASTRESLLLGAGTMALALVAGRLLAVSAAHLQTPVTEHAIIPPPSNAVYDRGEIYADGCHLAFNAIGHVDDCAYGDASARGTLVLFGDSHAAQWYPALAALATRRGLRLLARTKGSCPAPDVHVWTKAMRRRYFECDVWRESTIAEIGALPGPVLVVTSNARADIVLDPATGAPLSARAAHGAWRSGTEDTLRTLVDLGADVFVIRDTARPRSHMSSCVSEHLENPAACDFGRERIPDPRYDVDIARDVPGVRIIDLTESICLATHCPAVRDGVLVFRDSQHLTGTFVRTLTGRLEQAMEAALARASGAS